MAYPQEKLISVITATYNRAHLLVDLYHSLCHQSSFLFDWIVIDDGSSDGTAELVQNWIVSEPPFQILFHRKENGGKNRAINDALAMVSTPFVMIVDSDDCLTDTAIAFLSDAATQIIDNDMIAGVAGMRGQKVEDTKKYDLRRFILATNLERSEYHLQNDANEVYKTDLLRSHPFDVWPGEKFVPEETIWNQLALEGYYLRWYSCTTCIARYQDDGMTRSSWAMLKNNPMGYARMFNLRIALSKSFKAKVFNTLQFISCCLLGKNPHILFKCRSILMAMLLCFPGWLLSLRRKQQLKQI